MADIAKVQHKVMGWNDNKTGEQSNGLKVEVAIFILLIIGAIVNIGFLLGVGWPDELPDNFSNLLTVEAVKEYLDYKERLRAARLQFLTTIAASLGAIGVVFNLYYTGKREEAFNKSAIAANKSAEAALENAKAAQDKQITERFTKAVEQLASPEIAVRLGGIYSLERIANNSKDDHWTIMEVLTAFVRENRPLREEEEGEKDESLKIPTDIQAALTVLRRRNPNNDRGNVDLHNTDINKADLSGANLQEADLSGASLQEAKLNGAKLKEAFLYKANLRGANLQDANLQKAVFTGANLQEANLILADLQLAGLNSANLKGADLSVVNLQGATLYEANLQEVRLISANLQLANLREANLQGVNLHGAKLQGANLQGAKNLTQEQIEKTYGDSTTLLPESISRPEHWIEAR